MSIHLTSVLFSLLGGITVAVVSHFLSIRRKRHDELAEFRLRAYTDFINSVSQIITARRTGITSDSLENIAALNDAKIRICICAEEYVVNSLSGFLENGATLELESGTISFTQLCSDIRASLGNKTLKNNHGLSHILFNIEPSSYSYRTDEDK